jgi:hypothetical protein
MAKQDIQEALGGYRALIQEEFAEAVKGSPPGCLLLLPVFSQVVSLYRRLLTCLLEGGESVGCSQP